MNRKEDLINYLKEKIDEKFAKVEVTPYQQQRLKCMAEIIELIEKYEESPLTLADFLVWEEGVEYDFEDLYVLKVENNRLFKKSEECSSGWCNFALFTDKIEDLRQATKVEKLKAYHVKDEYSYECLMKELEEQGYEWRFGAKPTKSDIWRGSKNGVIIYCKEDKTITHSWLTYYENCKKDKYDLIEYYKEEPKFYAKIKGWELYSDNNYYWKYYTENELFADYKYENELYKTQFTKTKWNKLGINDTNADFEKVED